MIEKIKITLWDILGVWILGILIIIDIRILTYFGLLPKSDYLEIILCRDIIKNDLIYSLYWIILIYIIGLLFEPLSNYIFDKFLDRFYRKLPFNKHGGKKDKHFDNTYQPLMLSIIKNQYKIDLVDEDVYHFAKDFILENELGSTFMSFLAKYGFYRSATVLVFLDLIILISNFNKMNWLVFIIWCIVVIILTTLFYMRTRDFYNFQGRTVFNNFVIAHKK